MKALLFTLSVVLAASTTSQAAPDRASTALLRRDSCARLVANEVLKKEARKSAACRATGPSLVTIEEDSLLLETNPPQAQYFVTAESNCPGWTKYAVRVLTKSRGDCALLAIDEVDSE